MKKSLNYIILIVILLGVNLYLFLSPKHSNPDSESKAYFENKSFENLTGISFSYQDQEVGMRLEKGRWILNNQYLVDEGFFNTLISVLERVEQTRNISNWNGDVLGKMELSFGDEHLEYGFAGNPMQTKSFLIKNGSVAEVTVPGYRDNVIDIFKLHPDQWRDRLVVDGSWRTIQSLIIDYPKKEDLELTFNDKFFLVNGQQPKDSSIVVDYLNQFQYFQANEMISKGRFPRLDSLLTTDHLATLVFDDIKSEEPLLLKVFPKIEGQSYHLVTLDKNMMVVDSRRIDGILANPSDFQSE